MSRMPRSIVLFTLLLFSCSLCASDSSGGNYSITHYTQRADLSSQHEDNSVPHVTNEEAPFPVYHTQPMDNRAAVSLIDGVEHCVAETYYTLRKWVHNMTARSANYNMEYIAQEEPTCPVCLEELAPGDHHRLACGHGICCACLNEFSKYPSYTTYSGIWGEYHYACPQCRKQSPVRDCQSRSHAEQ